MHAASSRPWQLLLLTMVVALFMAPSARAQNLADGEVHKNVVVGTAPNQAVVNVKYDTTTGKSYIVVVSGTLKLNSGATTMASVPAGGAFVIDGFSGLSATAGGLDLGDPKITQNANTDEIKISICLSDKSTGFTFSPPVPLGFKLFDTDGTYNMTPGLRVTNTNKTAVLDDGTRRLRISPFGLSNDTVTSDSGLDSFDRTQLSAIGG